GFRCELFDVRSPVGGKEERDTEAVLAIDPGPALRQFVWRQLDVARVALGLANSAWNIADLALRLDDSDASAVHEQGIVDRLALARPFGDGRGFRALRSRASCVAKQGAIHLPSCRAEVLVGQQAGGCFVQFNVLSVTGAECRQEIELVGRGSACRSLSRGK